MIEKFSDVAMAQEETAQKSIDIKIEQLNAAKETNIARIKAQERIQVEKDKRRAELKKEKIQLERDKLRMEHELRLAQLRSAMTDQLPFTAGQIPDPSSSTSSLYNSPASSTPNLSYDVSNNSFTDSFEFNNNSIPVGSIAGQTIYLPGSQVETDE
jgi:hypothetical protein